MSYQHPDYISRSKIRTDWSCDIYTAYSIRLKTEYQAAVYKDGWASVDGDEWWGEFPSLADAENYLHIKFIKDENS